MLSLEVDLGSVLESELEQKWRYGALKGMYRLKLVSNKKKIQSLKG